jgi:DNA-directed RNA polymerase specialized sigma subunit
MTWPKDKQIIKGEIADYYFDEDVLVSMSKGVKRTVENIGQNVELVKSITNNTPIPLLI